MIVWRWRINGDDDDDDDVLDARVVDVPFIYFLRARGRETRRETERRKCRMLDRNAHDDDEEDDDDERARKDSRD